MADEREAEQLLSEALDAIALGYPFDGTEADKLHWLSRLREFMEKRAPVVRNQMRRIIREPD